MRVRPIRPEDTALEQRFFDRLSERSRFQRFMQHLPELPPQMLERFTHLDYEKELALVALDPSGEFIAVARYAPRPEVRTAGKTAEFALTVADASGSVGKRTAHPIRSTASVAFGPKAPNSP